MCHIAEHTGAPAGLLPRGRARARGPPPPRRLPLPTEDGGAAYSAGYEAA